MIPSLHALSAGLRSLYASSGNGPECLMSARRPSRASGKNGEMPDGPDRGRRPDSPDAIDVAFALSPREARSVAHSYWLRRTIRISPALAVLIAAFTIATGPPYGVGVFSGLALVAVVMLVVIAISDHGMIKKLRIHQRVRISQAGIQVAHPNADTIQYQWSEVTDCAQSNLFVVFKFRDGRTLHIPYRVLGSGRATEHLLGIAGSSMRIDTQKSSPPRVDVQRPRTGPDK